MNNWSPFIIKGNHITSVFVFFKVKIRTHLVCSSAHILVCILSNRWRMAVCSQCHFSVGRAVDWKGCRKTVAITSCLGQRGGFIVPTVFIICSISTEEKQRPKKTNLFSKLVTKLQIKVKSGGLRSVCSQVLSLSRVSFLFFLSIH